jgi:hypothetical protein
MPKVYASAESVQSIAEGLIPNYHPELATARIMYCFVDKASSKGGLELKGKVRKFSGFLEWALESDFVLEVALDKWNDLTESQRTALIDHLLECCTGEEDEESGAMTWKVREPNVQEFSSVLHRQGAWNESLQEFVTMAKGINIDEIVDEENALDANVLSQGDSEA